MIAQKEREGKLGCPLWDEGLRLRVVLSPGVELDVVDGDAVVGELEVVDGAHDGGVEAVAAVGYCCRNVMPVNCPASPQSLKYTGRGSDRGTGSSLSTTTSTKKIISS